ncbi:hypothetical protein [Blastococcus sp. TF02A-26]|uniref:hypothetical protein n=1 Tax=Blastococcus sp. TF02A-26 TaxID=2250577 RepID=UPI000DE973FE|nr:hypothetical protein [Blastococcus sp. TF02A-26]RBY85915.1 hypothetical protein DQ240_11035 [Blastococcus sp. TF02A-26]
MTTPPGPNGPDQQPGAGGAGWGQPPAGSSGGYNPPPPPPPGGATPPGATPAGQYQPQPGGAPYPPQGGAPYPPQQGAGQPFQQPKSGPPKWLIPVIGAVVLVAAALALFVFFGSNEAEVGDCVKAEGIDEIEIVDCDDNADGKVIGLGDDEVSFSDYQSDPFSQCAEFEETIGAFWQGEEGEDGTVVCVGPPN